MNSEKKKMPVIVIGDPHVNNSNIAELTEKLKSLEVKVIGMQEMSEEDIRTAIQNGYDENDLPVMVLKATKHDPPPFFGEKIIQPWQKRKGYKKYF